VNRRNAEGDTPLHFCVAGGHVELGEYLLGKGADERAVNARGVKPFGG
jgi:ankyrin repeat protein